MLKQSERQRGEDHAHEKGRPEERPENDTNSTNCSLSEADPLKGWFDLAAPARDALQKKRRAQR